MMTKIDTLASKILIVDDQKTNVLMLEQLLSGEGYAYVTSTTKPEEVCELHQKNDFDLILLDLKMPGMSGFEVMEALKSNASDAYLPVIVLTAEPAHKLRALQAGAKDFISKPFDLVEVKTRIHNMLEVRLLYRMLDAYNLLLEQKVQERTAELSESQDRFRSLTELASDWYWEQNENGHYTTVSGPVFEIMGISITELLNKNSRSETRTKSVGWDEVERKLLQNKIESRQPFLDMSISRTNSDGTKQAYRVSGEPIFNRACNFTGYRGIGTEVLDLY